MSRLDAVSADPFAAIQAATRAHRADHGCLAYTFEDGPALLQLAARWKPKRILELGTALGYTACCLGYGSVSAEVDTIEADAEHVALARGQIERVGLSGRVTVHHGRFEDMLPALTHYYELAFFDGFAPDPVVMGGITARLVTGGVLVCANLPLANRSVMRRLLDDLDDPVRWQREPSIEGGTSHVRIKLRD